MQFRVPQFLDIEDKVFGPFTFKQFGYLLGSIAFAYILWKLLPVYVSMPLIVVISGTFLALGFVEVNGRKFGDILESAAKYFFGAKIFVWQKKENPFKNDLTSHEESLLKQEKNTVNNSETIKHYSFDQIKELSRKLDVLESKEKHSSKDTNLREVMLKERNGFRL
jgi:hypothetical protein